MKLGRDYFGSDYLDQLPDPKLFLCFGIHRKLYVYCPNNKWRKLSLEEEASQDQATPMPRTQMQSISLPIWNSLETQ